MAIAMSSRTVRAWNDRFYVGKDTEIFGQAKAGDRIQVWVQPDGQAQTIIIVMSGTQ